jgi:hypothetical protein
MSGARHRNDRLRKIVIGGKSCADDFTVFWRGLPKRPEHGPAFFWERRQARAATSRYV